MDEGSVHDVISMDSIVFDTLSLHTETLGETLRKSPPVELEECVVRYGTVRDTA